MPFVPDRARTWMARFVGDQVIVRNYITDLEPDEDIQDEPPTDVLTRAQWAQRHEQYGLDAAGQPLEVRP